MTDHFCDRCDEPVHDESCKVVNPYDSRDVTIICPGCAERAYDRHQESLMSDGPGPSLIQQQQDAYKIKHGIKS